MAEERQRAEMEWQVSSPLAIHGSSIVSLHIVGPPFDLVIAYNSELVADEPLAFISLLLLIKLFAFAGIIWITHSSLCHCLTLLQKERAKYIYFIDSDIQGRRKRIWKDTKLQPYFIPKLLLMN